MDNEIQVDPCIYREIYFEKFIKCLSNFSKNILNIFWNKLSSQINFFNWYALFYM